MPLPGMMRDGQVKPEWGAQVDLSLPICQGLNGVWIFADFPVADGPASTYDSLGYLTGAYNCTGLKAKPGYGGPAMYFVGSNTGVITLPLNAKTDLTSGLSIASRFNWQGGTPNYNPLMSKWNTEGDHGYGLSLNPSSNLRCDSYNSSGSVLSGTTTIAANTWYDAVYSLSPLSQQLFVNGLPDATPNASPFMPGSGGTTPAALIGGDNGNGGSNRGWNGLIEYVYLWGRDLSQEEAAQIHELPYSIFRPSNVERFYSVASAGVSRHLLALRRKVIYAQ